MIMSPPSPVRAHFDREADRYDTWKRRNSYYYDRIKRAYAERIPVGSSVLDVGCGTGEILISLRPRRGVGIDLSRSMIDRAREKNPALSWYPGTLGELRDTLRETFDWVILSDVIEHLEDREGTFADLRRYCHAGTTIIVNMANPLWEPLLVLLEWCRWKMPEGPHHRISVRTLNAILERCGFQYQRRWSIVLVPLRIPLLTWMMERLESWRVLRSICLIHFLEYRRASSPEADPHQCS